MNLGTRPHTFVVTQCHGSTAEEPGIEIVATVFASTRAEAITRFVAQQLYRREYDSRSQR